MKIFANLFEMTKYMSFCPICSSSREVEISVGPDYLFKSPRISFCYNSNERFMSNLRRRTTADIFFDNKSIELNVEYSYGLGEYNTVSIDIDSYNTFYIKNGYMPAKDGEFFMYLQSQCRNCMFRFYSVTSDIAFRSDRKLSELQIEEDCIYMDNTQIHFDYIGNKVRVQKKDIFSVPMWDEDFRDKDKLTKRIKTILTFG